MPAAAVGADSSGEPALLDPAQASQRQQPLRAAGVWIRVQHSMQDGRVGCCERAGEGDIMGANRPPSEGVECRLGSSIIKTASPKKVKGISRNWSATPCTRWLSVSTSRAPSVSRCMTAWMNPVTRSRLVPLAATGRPATTSRAARSGRSTLRRWSRRRWGKKPGLEWRGRVREGAEKLQRAYGYKSGGMAYYQIRLIRWTRRLSSIAQGPASGVAVNAHQLIKFCHHSCQRHLRQSSKPRL